MALNLHLLRLFSTVAESGSFSRAADLLRISQPAISQGVRDFELQLGCRLLDRSHKGVTPTREGRALMRHANAVFSTERAAEEELKSLRSLDGGSLRVGASTTIATYLLPEYLGEFHRNYPGIDLHLVSANTREIASLLLDHKIEIALVEGPVAEPGLVSELWQTDAMTLITAPTHALALESALVKPERLCQEIMILREPGSGSREFVSHLLSALSITPARRLEIGSTEAIKQLVAAGMGVSIVSTRSVAEQVALGRLVMLEIAGHRLQRKLWMLKVPGRLSVPAAEAFEKLINQKRRPSAKAPSAAIHVKRARR